MHAGRLDRCNAVSGLVINGVSKLFNYLQID